MVEDPRVDGQVLHLLEGGLLKMRAPGEHRYCSAAYFEQVAAFVQESTSLQDRSIP
jgi:hypothetical protein